MEKTGVFKTLRSLGDLGREKTGIAAVEFALVVPFIIVLFLASVDAVFALTAKRKVAVATHSIADLSARAQNLSDGQLAAIADLGRLILTPFDVSESRIAITGAEVLDSGNQAIVRWSHLFENPDADTSEIAAIALLPTEGEAGAETVAEIPDGFVINLDANLSPGTFLVLSAVELPYRTFFQFLESRFNNGELFVLSDQAFFQSRSGSEITNLDL